MARRAELEAFAATHGLAVLTIAELIEYRRRREIGVRRQGESRIPTRHGGFRAVGFAAGAGPGPVALVHGDLGDGTDVLVRVQPECLTGDVFGSLSCDCGPQLDAALAAIGAEGRGVVVYMRGHEGQHWSGAQVLVDVGVRSMRLLTDNPTTLSALDGYGIDVLGQVRLPTGPHPENLHYLPTERGAVLRAVGGRP